MLFDLQSSFRHRPNQIDLRLVSASFASLPHLRAENYDHWVSAVGDRLFQCGLGPIADAIAARQEDFVWPGSPPTVDSLRSATGIIWTSLRQSVSKMSMVYSKTGRLPRGDIVAFMLTAQDVVRRRCAANDARLRHTIDNMRMSDFPKPMEYLEKMEDLFAIADAQGLHLTDQDKIFRLLNGLSAEFSYMKQMIYVQELTSVPQVIAILERAADSAPIVFSGGRSSTEAAYFARDAPRVSRRSGDAQPTKPCYAWRDTGKCSKANRCRFAHSTPAGTSSGSSKPPRSSKTAALKFSKGRPKGHASMVCSYCGFRGHTFKACSQKRRDDQGKPVGRGGSTKPVHWTCNTLDDNP